MLLLFCILMLIFNRDKQINRQIIFSQNFCHHSETTTTAILVATTTTPAAVLLFMKPKPSIISNKIKCH